MAGDFRRLGVLGLSEGNGHPFSFSAIINGYDREKFADAGWPVIAGYLDKRTPEEFGAESFRVTRAWTQDPELTQRLCRSCGIEKPVDTPEAMLGEVDGVLLARDDHDTHRRLAEPFLEAGIPVLVDKPLALDPGDLEYFRPHLESGLLMSASAMRFSPNVVELAAELKDLGRLRGAHGTVVLDWTKYGIHILEALFTIIPQFPVAIRPLASEAQYLALELPEGQTVTVHCLGASHPVFRVEVIGDKGDRRIDIRDNFSMFRNMLLAFHEQMVTGKPVIRPTDTLGLMQILRAGRLALEEDRKVDLDEVAMG